MVNDRGRLFDFESLPAQLFHEGSDSIRTTDEVGHDPESDHESEEGLEEVLPIVESDDEAPFQGQAPP